MLFPTGRATGFSPATRAAIKLDPKLAEAYYQLGRAYTKSKRAADAQTAMTTFKQLSESQKEQGLQERKEIVRKLADVVF